MTAICPTRNRPRWLPQAIRCFQQQTYPNLELVIVADGQDVQTTLANSLELGGVKPRHAVRYIYLQNDRMTIGGKRNFCCERARGEIIVHWDDDDWSDPRRIAAQADEMFGDIHVTGFYRCQFHSPESGRRYQWESSLRIPCGSSLMYRKSWWQDNRFRSIDVGEDVDFVERAHGFVRATDGNSYFQATIHEGNTSPRNLNLDMYNPL